MELTITQKEQLQVALTTPLHAVVMSQGKKTQGLTLFYGGTGSNGNCDNCSITCPFKNAGCYGEGYHCKRAWINSNMIAADLLAWLIENGYKLSEYIRFNEAGDLAYPGTSKINFEYLKLVVNAFSKTHKKVYTYTHCPPTDPHNIQCVKYALEHNFIISFSCETIDNVKTALTAGCPAVLTVNTMSKKHIVIDGINLLSCPANTDKNALCRKCTMCFHKYNLLNYVPVFALHGNDKKKAINKGFLSDI